MTLREAMEITSCAIRFVDGTWCQIERTNHGFDIDRGLVGQAESYYHEEVSELSHVFDYVQNDCVDWRIDAGAFRYAQEP